MSASLVGSEMCIRDSRRLLPTGVQDPPDLDGVTAADRDDEVGGVDEEAVSYTHLTLPTICSV
eukprot:5177507-Alexandrium_andersonii.AAC.1